MSYPDLLTRLRSDFSELLKDYEGSVLAITEAYPDIPYGTPLHDMVLHLIQMNSILVSQADVVVDKPAPASRAIDVKASLHPGDLAPIDGDLADEPKPLTEGQAKALTRMEAFVRQGGATSRYFVLRGYSGTGKTFLMQRLLDLELGRRILMSATTNKAAKVMTKMLGRPAKTVYSTLGIRMEPQEDQIVLTYPEVPPQGVRGSLLVIDESSMVGRDLLAFICKAAEELDLLVIFVGDPAQLCPVGERTSPVWRMASTLEPPYKSLLTEVKRYDDQLLVMATALRKHIKDKDYEINLREFHDSSKVIHLSSDRQFEKKILAAGSDVRVIAWRNRTVEYFNDMIRAGLGFKAPYCVGDVLLVAAPVVIDGSIWANVDDEVSVTEVLETSITHHASGSQIPVWRLMTKDDTSGTLVLSIPTPKGESVLASVLATLADQARAASGYRRKTLWAEFYEFKNRFHKVRYGFGITSHRSQGSTFKEVFVDAQDVLANPNTREAFQCLYVAVTRAASKVYIN